MRAPFVSVLAAAALVMATTPALAAGDAAAGKEKAGMCADCHGDDGKGDDKVPGIAGMSADKFIAAMEEYRNGTRAKPPMMVKAAKKLSPEEIANLAAYYATLK